MTKNELMHRWLLCFDRATHCKDAKIFGDVYLSLVITHSQSSAQLWADSSGFFRAIWVDEVVIEGIEIRPMGLDSLEFDEAGTAEVSFLAIKPGTYSLGVPGSELQRVEIVIK